MKKALLEERYDELVVEAVKQVEAGAEVLDVNVGLPGIDEPETMKRVVRLLQEVVTLPLQIDSSEADAIENACRYYNGKPLINSVNGKDEVMEKIFPIAKKYGGVVIGLTLEDGIPLKAEERFEIAKKIVNKAAEYGIGKEKYHHRLSDINSICTAKRSKRNTPSDQDGKKRIRCPYRIRGIECILWIAKPSVIK